MRQLLRQRQNRSAHAVGADAECAVGVHASLPRALARFARTDTLHHLPDSHAVGGNASHPDALRAAVDPRVAAANDGPSAAENASQNAAVEIRIPGSSHPGTESAIERLKRVFGLRGNVLDGRK